MSHETISKVASRATYGSSALAVTSAAAVPATPSGADIVWGLTTAQWGVVGVLAGVFGVIGGLLINAFFKWQYNKIVAAKKDAEFPSGD